MFNAFFGTVATGVTTFLAQAVARMQRIIKKNPGPLFINFSIRNFLVECFAVSIQAPCFFPLPHSSINIAELVENITVMFKVRRRCLSRRYGSLHNLPCFLVFLPGK